MRDTPGVTRCGSCNGVLEPTQQCGARPVDVVTQECVECSDPAVARLLWYPDETYEIIALTVDSPPCECCDSTATTVVVDGSTELPSYYCTGCRMGHHEAALSVSVQSE